MAAADFLALQCSRAARSGEVRDFQVVVRFIVQSDSADSAVLDLLANKQFASFCLDDVLVSNAYALQFVRTSCLSIRDSCIVDFLNVGQLQRLSLVRCALESLDCVCAPHLKFLDVSDNRITVLPGAGQFPELETLVINRNPLASYQFDSDLSVRRISMNSCGLQRLDFIARLESLEYLSASDNCLQDFAVISKLSKLRVLNLERQRFENSLQTFFQIHAVATVALPWMRDENEDFDPKWNINVHSFPVGWLLNLKRLRRVQLSGCKFNQLALTDGNVCLEMDGNILIRAVFGRVSRLSLSRCCLHELIGDRCASLTINDVSGLTINVKRCQRLQCRNSVDVSIFGEFCDFIDVVGSRAVRIAVQCHSLQVGGACYADFSVGQWTSLRKLTVSQARDFSFASLPGCTFHTICFAGCTFKPYFELQAPYWLKQVRGAPTSARALLDDVIAGGRLCHASVDAICQAVQRERLRTPGAVLDLWRDATLVRGRRAAELASLSLALWALGRVGGAANHTRQKAG